MASTEQAVEDRHVDRAAAFAAIGNETRLAILQALFDEKFRPLPFAELRKRVGIRDGSQFNYHLKKLEGPFVRKTDEGYELRHAGMNVIRSVVAGSFTDHPRIPPFETGGACVVCGDPLQGEYTQELVLVGCSSCESMLSMGILPPGALTDRTPHDVLTAAERLLRRSFDLSANGVCSVCFGRTTGTLVRDADEIEIRAPADPGDFPSFDLGRLYECGQCDVWDFGTAGHHVLDHPDVVAFHREHGVDLEAVPYWELDWVVTNERTDVVAEDPFRVQVTIPLADEALHVTLDEAFDVVETERVPAPTRDDGGHP